MEIQLPKAKDIILKHLIVAESNEMHTWTIHHRLKLPIYLVNAALVDLRDLNFITMIETTGKGSGKDRSYMVQTVEGAGKYFSKNKTFYWQNFWDKVKYLLKHYSVLVVFAMSLILNVYLNSSLRTLQTEKRILEGKVAQLTDSLNHLKR